MENAFERMEELLKKPEFKEVLLKFKDREPYSLSEEHKLMCLRLLNSDLNSITGNKYWFAVEMVVDSATNQLIIPPSCAQVVFSTSHTPLGIVLLNKLSIISFLSGWGRLLGLQDEVSSLAWAKTVFKEYFPERYSRLKVYRDDKGNEIVMA